MIDTRVKAIEFDEEKHKYWFTDSNGKHRELHGVTGAIGKLMGKSFPDTGAVKLATIYGSDVHKEVENYYNSDSKILSSDGAKWVVEYLEQFKLKNFVNKIECEVMVSDFEGTASKIDVVTHTTDGTYLFDIKTTSHFDREYCSLQLSVYKKLFEQNYDEHVLDMYVLGTKSKRAFRIIQQEDSRVNKILNMNKGVQVIKVKNK